MIPDTINAMFESVGGLFALHHCLMLYRAKEVRGFSIPAVVFWTLWGYWNMWYYPHLDQWRSFWGGILVVAANTLYVAMIVYYTKPWLPYCGRCDMRTRTMADGKCAICFKYK